MRRFTGQRLGRGLLLLAFVAACSSTASQDFDDPNDPLGDSFFRDGFGQTSLDEVLDERAPSVGWLSNEDLYDQERAGSGAGEDDLLQRERAAAGAGEVVEAERRTERERAEAAKYGDDYDESSSSRSSGDEKSFGEKAQEATMATMSVLIGAGMVALPYLLGT